ncbi:hypothetical protein B0H15DRAFT_922120 [Mycena belliarum]|uniref:CxC2-like cysteine cluster KDZ transposase-associated domain-containing protein n=1 Tax=Mycena belliarum TaxID=1033014 RepID=A0AAD6U947_9AGAR|nr:hypothetical protein B0H15DRAFT_922120 [Mycena belliae]
MRVESSFVDTSTPAVPSHWEEDVQTAQAMDNEDFSYLCGDSAEWTGMGADNLDGAPEDGITMEMGADLLPVGHFERWEDADNPMKYFVKNCRDEALDEMLRNEGRGLPHLYGTCGECKAADPLFRCARQTCIGPAMYCEPCIVKLHRQLPTHTVEKWTAGFFKPMPLGELDVEARIQLGHIPGTYCPSAQPAHKDFVVMDTLGIRVVKLSFCGCDTRVTHRQQLMRACLWPATSKDPQTCATFNVIRLFEVQNCLGKISAYDYVRSLELLTNGDGLTPPPDRRRAFRAIARQYRMMEMLKRAGRGNDDSGVRGTKQGELALDCRACPQPGINLPDDWDKIDWDTMDEDQRYKYYLELSEDANFKLINRNIGTEEKDPVVDDGAGYFCNRAEYSEHIRKHVDEEEISSCSGFQAMFLANAKRVKGLRVTGIGGVTCARHNMWRPNGIGDLQAGERYCNMTFLMLSALMGFMLSYLIFSYDIACQFSKGFWGRQNELPPRYRLSLDPAKIRWMVPNWHVAGHKKGCHSPFSFHWLWGAGRTHGETVEQNWEFLNGIAAATKMMGLGARYTALEGLFGFHNWRRLIAHRLLLMQRMAEGIKEGRAHKDAFAAFHAGLEQVDGLDLEAWRSWADKWETEQHAENEKNSPYEYEEEGQTLKEIRLKLASEEYARTGDGTEVEREDSPTVAIKAAGPTPSTTQELDFLKRRGLLRTRLQAFRKVQLTYMPRLRRYLSPTQKLVWDADDKQPEATRLFMPSELASRGTREKACAAGLDGVEARLRTGEAGEALAQIRQGLRTRTMTNRFKIRNWSGQRALTRGQGILRQINIKIHAAKLRYRYARQALLKLKGHGDWEKTYRVLQDDDVRALNARSLREEEQAHDELLGALGVAVGIEERGALAMGEGHRTLSWIWYMSSALDKDDKKLHEGCERLTCCNANEALRVEWCKAYSRANRWREDLVKVEEEMRRTIAFGEDAERKWRKRAEARTRMLGKTGTTIEPEVLEGARAYALEHVDRERRVCEKLAFEWRPIRAMAAAYLKGGDISQMERVVVQLDPDQVRWVEAASYQAEEVENDMYQ